MKTIKFKPEDLLVMLLISLFDENLNKALKDMPISSKSSNHRKPIQGLRNIKFLVQYILKQNWDSYQTKVYVYGPSKKIPKANPASRL